jgi:hypothetical protein
MKSRNTDNAPKFVVIGHFTIDNQPLGTFLFQGGGYGVDNGFSSAHHFAVSCHIHLGAVDGKKVEVRFAECFSLRSDAAELQSATFMHYKASLPILHEKGDVRNAIQQLFEGANTSDLLEEPTLKAFGGHERILHTNSLPFKYFEFALNTIWNPCETALN